MPKRIDKFKMFELIQKGYSQKEIAKQTNCNISTVQRYKKLYREIHRNEDNNEATIIETVESTEIIHNELLEIPNTLNNYNAELELLFCDYQLILENLLKIHNYIRQIPELYETISKFDCDLSELEHNMEGSTTIDEYIKYNIEWYTIRKQRRLCKNKYFLALKLRDTLNAHRVHSAVFEDINTNIQQVIEYCRNPKYTPRTPKKYMSKEEIQANNDQQLDEWQMKIKDIVNKDE